MPNDSLSSMTILRTQFVAIDTSTLNKLAKDQHGTDARLREHAASVLDSLQADNWIPVITFHHLSEMVQHADRTVAVERLRFLRGLPLLAWVKSLRGDGFPGTVVDIDAREVRALISGRSTLHEIVNEVREDLFNVATGAQLIPDDPDFVDVLRSQVLSRVDEQNKIVSIVRSDAADVRHVKLKTMMAGQPRTQSGRMQSAAQFRDRLEKQLTKHGDERLTDAGAIAHRFTSAEFSRVEEVVENDSDDFQRVLGLFGLRLCDIDPEMTMEDLGFLTTFRGHLRTIGSVLKTERPLSVQDVDQNLCPSWRLRREIQRRQNSAARVKGSNLTDAYLIGLGIYADAIEVDKRTLDFVRQVGDCDREITQHVNRSIKCSTYGDLPTQLSWDSNT